MTIPEPDKLYADGSINPYYYDIGIDGMPGLKSWHPTGSFFICKPQVTDTDKDYVVLVEDTNKAPAELEKLGYARSCADEEEYELGGGEAGFACMRRNDINLIVTDSVDFYDKWTDASILARGLNLLKKDDRIALFKYVLYGELVHGPG